MLEKNPEKRANIHELRENDWINEGCKTSLVQEEYYNNQFILNLFIERVSLVS